VPGVTTFLVGVIGLLVGVSIATWIGLKLGAFATMRVSFPVSFWGIYAYWVSSRSVDELRSITCNTLLSLMTVFSFVIPYYLLLRLAGERIERSRGALLFLAGAWGTACGLRLLHQPVHERIMALPLGQRMAFAYGVAVVLMVGVHWLVRLPSDDRVPAPADCPLQNWMLRLITLTGVVIVLHDPEWSLTWVGWMLSSIPRITVELSVGAHASNGPRSARHVLAGMPLGLLPGVGFCILLGVLLPHVPRWWAFGLSVTASLAVSSLLLAMVLREQRELARPSMAAATELSAA
jgi:hypothetical protein